MYPTASTKWKITTQEEQNSLSQDLCLPQASKAPPIAFVLTEKKKTYALSQAPNANSFPVITYTWEDLKQKKTWENILEWHPIEKVILAHYWKCILKPHNIDSTPLILAYGLVLHFQNKSDWEELSKLDVKSHILSRKYNFPLRILRLWNRFSEEDQNTWLRIWESFSLNQNLIGDIICDYCELSQIAKNEIQKKLEALEKSLENIQKKVIPLSRRKGREIRDMVRETRLPQISKARNSFYQKKRKLKEHFHEKLPQKLQKSIQICLPEGMETHNMELHICFDNIKKLQQQQNIINDQKTISLIQNLLEEIQS